MVREHLAISESDAQSGGGRRTGEQTERQCKSVGCDTTFARHLHWPFFGRCKSQLHRSLSLLLGLRQLQGLLLRQRSHCQVWLVSWLGFSSIKNGASKVPGTSALRWAFHRLKRKSRFPSRLPMRHVSRASMVWHWAGKAMLQTPKKSFASLDFLMIGPWNKFNILIS